MTYTYTRFERAVDRLHNSVPSGLSDSPGYLTRDLVERVRHLPYTQHNLISELAELTCAGIHPAG